MAVRWQNAGRLACVVPLSRRFFSSIPCRLFPRAFALRDVPRVGGARRFWPAGSAVGGVAQNFVGPLIDALARGFGGDADGCMHFRPDAQHEFAGCGFLGGYAPLGAVGEEVVDGVLELPAKIGHGVGMEADDGAHAEHAPDEDAVAVVKIDARGVSPRSSTV